MRIPGYRLLKEIDKGGTATVYLGVQQSLGRKVAIKVINQLEQKIQSHKFLEEGKTVASLNHQNIVTVHDIGRIEQYHYIAMELMEGGSLADKIKQGMHIDEVYEVMVGMGKCLQYVHDKGIVHRDIKPGNILFLNDGTPKLGDFGIAKKMDEDCDDALNGYALGSPYYVSPELVLGKSLDARSDLYGLGIVLYEMLTGKKPFIESSHIKTMVAHVNQPVPRLPARYQKFQELVDKLTAKSPRDRFANAKEMLVCLEKIRRTKDMLVSNPASPDISTQSAASWMPRPRLAIAATVGFMAVGAALIGIQGNLDASFLEQAETSKGAPKLISGSTGQNQNDNAGDSETPSGQDPGISAVPTKDRSADGTGSQANANQIEPSNLKFVASVRKVNEADPEVQQLLSAAEDAVREFRLTQPEGNSAYDYYQRIQLLDPGNADANKGLEGLADLYAGMSRRQLETGDTQHAKVYYRRGLTVLPTHSKLQQVGAEIKHAEQMKREAGLLLENEAEQSIELAKLENEYNDKQAIVESIPLCPEPANWGDVWKIVVGEYCPREYASLEEHQDVYLSRR